MPSPEHGLGKRTKAEASRQAMQTAEPSAGGNARKYGQCPDRHALKAIQAKKSMQEVPMRYKGKLVQADCFAGAWCGNPTRNSAYG